MTETAREDQALGAARIAVAEAWADFAKALAFYPEKHERVRATAARFLDVFAVAIAAASVDSDRPDLEGVEVIFHGRGLLVCGQPVETPRGSNLDWVKERIYSSSLAG